MSVHSRHAARILVLGSLNVDYVASVERLPRPGETIVATGLVRYFGGKGANQAVAAARQGGRVSLLGCVGDDDEGKAYQRRLRQEGIDIGAVGVSGRALTGTALIAVDGAGENAIVVASGANGQLTAAAVRAQARRFEAADILLLQFESPMPAVLEGLRLADGAGVPVVLNPSPLRPGFPWGRYKIETLIVNRGEAEALFGLRLAALEKDLIAWRRELRKKNIDQLVITNGARPTMCLSQEACSVIPTLSVRPLDTVGAGDAFAGTFVTRRAEGADLASAARFANCAGALATMKRGAQESSPRRAATEKAARKLNGICVIAHGQRANGQRDPRARLGSRVAEGPR